MENHGEYIHKLAKLAASASFNLEEEIIKTEAQLRPLRLTSKTWLSSEHNDLPTKILNDDDTVQPTLKLDANSLSEDTTIAAINNKKSILNALEGPNAKANPLALRRQQIINEEMNKGALVLDDNNNDLSSNDDEVQKAVHPKWKLMRVISGHIGWVRCLDVEPGNQWFCSGAGDRTIKIWDLASGALKLTLTGHLSTVRGVAVSPRHPYLFSCGEDKTVKCWDLETNKAIRNYHGHLSGVYSLALHPTLDVLVTAGRDAVARVWDIRTKQEVHVLSGHSATISSVKCQPFDPQVITASMDSHIRLWDLAAGKTMTTLTHHKKSVRDLALHPQEFTFSSASGDAIKQWKLPEGIFMRNFDKPDTIVNCLAINEDNVMFSGADNGRLSFYDTSSGKCFQSFHTPLQPGSLDSEAGIFSCTFDKTGLRLITGNADKSIKIYKVHDSSM